MGHLCIIVTSQYGKKTVIFVCVCDPESLINCLLGCFACDACHKWIVEGRGKESLKINIERNLAWVKSNVSGMFISLFLLNKNGKVSVASKEN